MIGACISHISACNNKIVLFGIVMQHYHIETKRAFTVIFAAHYWPLNNLFLSSLHALNPGSSMLAYYAYTHRNETSCIHRPKPRNKPQLKLPRSLYRRQQRFYWSIVGLFYYCGDIRKILHKCRHVDKFMHYKRLTLITPIFRQLIIFIVTDNGKYVTWLCVFRSDAYLEPFFPQWIFYS